MDQPAKFNGSSKRGCRSSRCTIDGEMIGLPPTSFTNCTAIFDRFFPAHAVGRATERKIDRKVLEETENGRPLVDADARQLANTNARVRQRRHLRAREEVEAVFVVVLVYKNLRRLFRRDCLLNVVGENLAKGEIRSDVHIGRGDETVFEIVNAVDVKTRTTLIGMRCVSLLVQRCDP